MSAWKQVLLGLAIVLVNLLGLLKQILLPIYRVLFSSRVPSVIRTPEDRFKSLANVGYNFQSNYIELDGGCGVKLPRVHYLDEGPRHGKVVLCLHGEPTWSFLYRHMVPTLVDAGYRVIVPDFIGFGKSDKYSSLVNYTHELHTMTLRLLIDQLNIQDISLVCQDWGGMTGLSVVKDCPGRFSSLIIMNTGLPDPILDFSNPKGVIATLKRAMPFGLWRSVVLLLGTWLPLSLTFKAAFSRVKNYKLSSEVLSGYLAPHPTPMYCGGVAAWPLLVPLFKDDPVTPSMREAKNALKIWRKPALVMFSDSDPITRGQDKMFLDLLPDAKCVTVRGAGHFLQETHGLFLADEIVKFLSDSKITTL